MKTKKLAEIDERVEKNSQQNDEMKLNFNDDYRYFGRSSFGILIQDKYCKCGRVRSAYEEKLPPSYGTKCNNIYDMDKMANEVFELDKGAIYLTKKSLMLNQFLEYNDTSTMHANDNTVNRFGLNVSNNKGYLKSATFNVVQVPENKTTQTLCLPSSVFSDKRLVSLFRSVALYWFFCLNTVLAKGEVFKRKTLTAFDLQKNNPIAFASNLELQISPDIFENFNDLSNDFLWNVSLNDANTEESASNVSSLLLYAEHSKEKLIDDLFKKVLLNLAGTSGIFDSGTSKNMNKIGDDVVQRDSAGERRSPTSPKKAASPKSAGRKYAFDDFDYGYLGTFFNRIVWKKRAIKNKSKTKRKSDGNSRNERIQEIIMECVDDNQFTDDTIEEVVAVYEEPNVIVYEQPSVIVYEQPSVIVYDEPNIVEEFFVQFDDYVQDLKREEEEYENMETNELKSEDEVTSNVSVSTKSPEIEDSYFLPDGMLNVEEKDYPEYDLWGSPLIAEQVIPSIAVKSAPKPYVEPSTPDFKPYRLWESSFAPEDDLIPNFHKEEFFSVFSMPYYPRKTRHQTRQEPSVYNLWGSPNIIDFLPGVGCVRFLDNDYSSSRCSSSTDSLEFEYPNEAFEVLKTQRRDNHFVRGKFLNFKPVINGFVSFTDRGAFEYYKKPERKERKARSKGSTHSNACVPMDAADVEVKNIIVDPKPKTDDDSIFQPIQPAIHVETDAPACIERSESGTFIYNNRKLLTYKHELDSRCAPIDLFQPKFSVSTNDVACQTERFGCHSRMCYSRCDEPVSQFYSSNADKRNQEQYISGAAFFYSLEEVFNFLGKPGLGNIGE